MHVYIDESGTFAHPSGKRHAVGVIAAVIMPSEFHDIIIAECRHLFARWGYVDDEPKARAMSEEHFAALFSLLGHHFVLVEFSAIDIAAHTAEHISWFQHEQARRLTAHLGPAHHPQLVDELHTIAAQMRGLPQQLFVQLMIGTTLVESIIRYSILYLVQRSPRELGEFSWIIDRKSETETPVERMWRLLLPGFLQATCLQKPLMQLAEADYSHFSRFQGQFEKTPPHLDRGQRGTGAFEYVDVARLFRDNLRFADSRSEIGLVLADFAANCARRAMTGRLRESGWRALAHLTVQLPRDESRLLGMRSGAGTPLPSVARFDPHIRPFFAALRTHGRPMFV